MAYQNKYKITVATKANTISYLYLLENDYDGGLIEYPATNLGLQYIPKSDDVFEAIIASQLNVTIDVTEGDSLMPDFTTLNDRKYLAQLYNEDVIEWQGWVISDSVSISYSTGRKEVSFNCVDGIGILERIKYPFNYSTFQLTNIFSCLDYISTSLSQIGFPSPLNIISGISYYAQGMTNRFDSISSEPLIQSYLGTSTFLDNNTVALTCLDVLSQIIKGFGARIFQAENKWYIVTPNEFAQDEYYYTEYNSNGTVVNSGIKSFTGNIEGFTGNTSGLYYVDNSQTKILRKGYNKISFSKTIDYPNNFITNANLMLYTGNNAYGWTQNATGGAIVDLKVYEKADFNSFILYSGNVGTASVYPNYLPTLKYNDVINLSFDLSNIVVNSSETKIVKVLLTLYNTDRTYHLNSDKAWVTTYATYDVPYDGGAFPTPAPSISKSVSIDIPPAPENGILYIAFINDTSCIDWCEISNFRLDVSQLYKSITIESYINNVDEYVYTPDINIGINYTVVGQFYYRGALCGSDGNNLTNWYRLEYPTVIKNSLVELVIQQYSSILEHNIINIDSTFFGLENNTGRLSGAMRFTSNDTDTVNSVEGKKYILGNSNINIVNAEIQSTLLEITDANATVTMTTTYEDTNPQRIFGRYRSNGETTSAGANAAPLTTNKIYQGGGFFYTDRNLAHPFNGGNLYYKVESENIVQWAIWHISPTGKIIAFEPR